MYFLLLMQQVVDILTHISYLLVPYCIGVHLISFPLIRVYFKHCGSNTVWHVGTQWIQLFMEYEKNELFSLGKREISQMKLEHVHLVDIASFPTEIGKISFKIDYVKIVNFKWNIIDLN